MNSKIESFHSRLNFTICMLYTQVTHQLTIHPKSYKAQTSAHGNPQIPHFITRPAIPDWSKSMQDNSHHPHPSITSSPPPLCLHPSTLSSHLAVSPCSPSIFLPSFRPFNSPTRYPHSIPVLHQPLANYSSAALFPPSIHPLFSPHLTRLFSSLPCIIPLISRGACNTAVVYNMSVVITDSLAMQHQQ